MLKSADWKKYLIIVSVIAVISVFFNYLITVGIVLGTLCYFVNLKLAEKKFPRLDQKSVAVGGALAVIFAEGLITCIMAAGTWFIGRMPCFIGGFAAMIVPNIYFFIFGSKK